MSQNAEMEIALTEQRKNLNEVEQEIKLLISQKISSRPETTLALRSTQLATMWLGKSKGALGINTPYPNSMDPSNKTIEPRADVAPEVKPFTDHFTETQLVKMVRSELTDISSKVERNMDVLRDNRKWQICTEQAWIHASTATMWLGMVLNAIKTEQDAPKAKVPSTVNQFFNNLNPFKDAGV